MTEQAISPLRRRMIEDMAIRKLGAKTQHDYVQRVKDFAAVFPRRVHVAGSDRQDRLSEQGRDLRPAVQGLIGGDADDRGRSQASRRPHRLLVCPPYLGLGAPPPSPRAHDRAGRRILRAGDMMHISLCH